MTIITIITEIIIMSLVAVMAVIVAIWFYTFKFHIGGELGIYDFSYNLNELNGYNHFKDVF